MGTKQAWRGKSVQDYPKVWFLEGTSQGTYLSKYVFNARLEKREKLYLCYVAAMNHFGNKTPCFATRDEMMNALSMCKDTLNKTKQKLIDLGWIVVYGRVNTSDLQFSSIGKDDPNSKWKIPDRKQGV